MTKSRWLLYFHPDYFSTGRRPTTSFWYYFLLMNQEQISQLLNKETLEKIFPASRSNEFFDALFGDAAEGAYDIELSFKSVDDKTLTLELLLHQRPNCCLACNLTQGLPQVFSRHPVIDIAGVVGEVNSLLGDEVHLGEWSLGYTTQYSSEIHAIPVNIQIC